MKVKEEERRGKREEGEWGLLCEMCFARFEILREEELISDLTPSLSLSLSLSPLAIRILSALEFEFWVWIFFPFFFSSAFLFQNLIELCFLEKTFSSLSLCLSFLCLVFVLGG
jgi:hypothetical protein